MNLWFIHLTNDVFDRGFETIIANKSYVYVKRGVFSGGGERCLYLQARVVDFFQYTIVHVHTYYPISAALFAGD